MSDPVRPSPIDRPRAIAFGLFNVVAGIAAIVWATGGGGPSSEFVAHYDAGQQLLDAGHADQALAQFEAAIREDDSLAEGHYARALALQQLDRFAEARDGYRAALERDPQMYLALHNLAAVQLELHEVEPALQTIEAARRVRDDDPVLHHNRGVALSWLGRFEEAVPAFDRALELGNTSAETRHRRGLALSNLDRWPEALVDFQAASEIEPENPEYLLFCAVALGRVRRPAEALPLLDRAIALRPGHRDQHYFRAAALLSVGRMQEASAEVERTLAIDPEYAPALELRARLAPAP